MKKGYTLLEMVVAMGIFSVFTTMVVGSFIITTNIRALALNMSNAQEKMRRANDMITRYSRLAQKVETPEDKTLILYFNIIPVADQASTPKAIKFTMSGSDLVYSECNYLINKTCSSWEEHFKIMGEENDIKLISAESSFIKNETGLFPPSLSIYLKSIATYKGTSLSSNPYYNNIISINNKVILENIK